MDIPQDGRGTPGSHYCGRGHVLIFNEALLGALLVLLRLTADNHSPARAVYLTLHLANTLLLLGALALSADFLSAGDASIGARTFFATATDDHWIGLHPFGGNDRNAGRPERYAISGKLLRLCAGPGFLQRRQLAGAPAPSSPCLCGSRRFVYLLAAAARPPSPRGSTVTIGVSCSSPCSVRLGSLMWCCSLPLWLQITHLLGADLLWIALVVLVARVSVVGNPGTL